MFVQEKDDKGYYYLKTQHGNFNKQDEPPGHIRPYLALKNKSVVTSVNKSEALRFKKTQINDKKAIFVVVN